MVVVVRKKCWSCIGSGRSVRSGGRSVSSSSSPNGGVLLLSRPPFVPASVQTPSTPTTTSMLGQGEARGSLYFAHVANRGTVSPTVNSAARRAGEGNVTKKIAAIKINRNSLTTGGSNSFSYTSPSSSSSLRCSFSSSSSIAKIYPAIITITQRTKLLKGSYNFRPHYHYLAQRSSSTRALVKGFHTHTHILDKLSTGRLESKNHHLITNAPSHSANMSTESVIHAAEVTLNTVTNAVKKAPNAISRESKPDFIHFDKPKAEDMMNRSFMSPRININDEEERFVGSIDQGTTSSRFIIFNTEGQPVASHQIEFENIYPQSG